MAGEQDGTPPSLELAGAPRVEHYELMSAAGYVVEVEHDLDTGAFAYTETTRTELADGAWS